MTSLIKAEFYKIIHSTSFWILSVLIILFSIVSGASFWSDVPDIIDSSNAAWWSEGQEIMPGYQMVFQLSMKGYDITLLIGIIFSALFIGNEFKNRTINRSLYFGLSRRKLFTAKMIVYIFTCTSLSLLYFILICLLFAKGWEGEVPINGIMYILRCLGVKIAFETALLSIAAFISFLFRDFRKSLFIPLVTLFALLSTGIIPSNFLMPYFKSDVLILNVVILAVLSIGTILIALGLSYKLFKECDIN